MSTTAFPLPVPLPPSSFDNAQNSSLVVRLLLLRHQPLSSLLSKKRLALLLSRSSVPHFNSPPPAHPRRVESQT
ncbi:hypothetical protein CDEST_01446 [Colletotrichum destructivum]|uniref:Uncharacterized protein n=1 Tax=Colletotrichum destructivum TaxID=34406 RepID=A0AAX4HZC0_9PEZI|nr:hypothetical protein CDEST_01446 [Colletotrichum destructivum]